MRPRPVVLAVAVFALLHMSVASRASAETASAEAASAEAASAEAASAEAASAEAAAASAAAASAEAESCAEARAGAEAKAVSVRARVFVRSTVQKLDAFRAQWGNEFSLASSRVSLVANKYGWMTAELEVEFSAGKAKPRDIDVRLEPTPRLFFQVGHFKRPISQIAMTSVWELPVIERGLLSEQVETANYSVPLNLGGRSEGVMISYHAPGRLKSTVHVGLFNARLAARKNNSDADLEALADNLLRDIYLRSEIEPMSGLRLGGTLVGFTQARFADDLRTRVLGSLDLSLDTRYVRGWLEGFAGRTPFFDDNESVGGLTGLRVLLAGRWQQPLGWIRRIEPFALFSALDLSDEKNDNQALEFGGGVAVYLKKNLRIQVEYTNTAYDDKFPQSNFALIDRQTIRLQLGARLR